MNVLLATVVGAGALFLGLLAGVAIGVHGGEAASGAVAMVWTDEQAEPHDGVVYRRLDGKWRRLDVEGCVRTERDGIRGWACSTSMTVKTVASAK